MIGYITVRCLDEHTKRLYVILTGTYLGTLIVYTICTAWQRYCKYNYICHICQQQNYFFLIFIFYNVKLSVDKGISAVVYYLRN